MTLLILLIAVVSSAVTGLFFYKVSRAAVRLFLSKYFPGKVVIYKYIDGEGRVIVKKFNIENKKELVREILEHSKAHRNEGGWI